MPTYSSHASDGFNLRMHHIMHDLGRDLADALGDKLIAVVVGGSYGRGDGRCLSVSHAYGSGIWSVGQAPVDDLDLVLITSNRFEATSKKSALVLRKYAAILGVRVSIVLSVTRENLGSVQRSVSLYQLARSHSVVYGPEDILDPVRALFVFDTPQHEKPGFTNDEIIRFHYDSGLFAIQAQKSSRKQGLPFSKLVARLADVLFFESGIWQTNAETRIASLRAIVSSEPWFLAHGDLIDLLIITLNRSEEADTQSMAGNNDTDDQGKDVALWGTYAQLWLFVMAYITHSEQLHGHGIESIRNSLISRYMHASVHNSMGSGFVSFLLLAFLSRRNSHLLK